MIALAKKRIVSILLSLHHNNHMSGQGRLKMYEKIIFRDKILFSYDEKLSCFLGLRSVPEFVEKRRVLPLIHEMSLFVEIMKIGAWKYFDSIGNDFKAD